MLPKKKKKFTFNTLRAPSQISPITCISIPPNPQLQFPFLTNTISESLLIPYLSLNKLIINSIYFENMGRILFLGLNEGLLPEIYYMLFSLGFSPPDICFVSSLYQENRLWDVEGMLLQCKMGILFVDRDDLLRVVSAVVSRSASCRLSSVDNTELSFLLHPSYVISGMSVRHSAVYNLLQLLSHHMRQL